MKKEKKNAKRGGNKKEEWEQRVRAIQGRDTDGEKKEEEESESQERMLETTLYWKI